MALFEACAKGYIKRVQSLIEVETVNCDSVKVKTMSAKDNNNNTCL